MPLLDCELHDIRILTQGLSAACASALASVQRAEASASQDMVDSSIALQSQNWLIKKKLRDILDIAASATRGHRWGKRLIPVHRIELVPHA